MLYLALGIAGLPVFAASPLLPQGAARLLGPTGGYLMSYPLAAFVDGGSPSAASIAATHRRRRDGRRARGRLSRRHAWLRSPRSRRADLVGARRRRRPFIVPDVLKLVVAAGVMPGLWKLTRPVAPLARAEHEQ
jgi:biotin transport system substrate-specific component